MDIFTNSIHRSSRPNLFRALPRAGVALLAGASRRGRVAELADPTGFCACTTQATVYPIMERSKPKSTGPAATVTEDKLQEGLFLQGTATLYEGYFLQTELSWNYDRRTLRCRYTRMPYGEDCPLLLGN